MRSIWILILALALVPAVAGAAKKASAASFAGLSAKQSAPLKAVDEKYQRAKSVAMKVDKTLKIGLLGDERKSTGTLWLAGGRLRMELDGTEKTLLVINKKNLWAVTYPGPEFPDAPAQVIKGDASNKKGQSKNIMSLLSVGGFLKFFKPVGVETSANGETHYELAPKANDTDFKRARVSISRDGKYISEIKYWDLRDNETDFAFHDVTFDAKTAFGKAVDGKLFDFVPPQKAETMNL